VTEQAAATGYPQTPPLGQSASPTQAPEPPPSPDGLAPVDARPDPAPADDEPEPLTPELVVPEAPLDGCPEAPLDRCPWAPELGEPDPPPSPVEV
jgi:hypothetical protein